MHKNTVLSILNPVLAILLLTQLLSGVFRGYLPDEAFEVVHEGGGILLVLCAVVHLALNWGWVRASIFRRKRQA